MVYNLINNYIYLYHIDKFILLPVYPEQVSDSMQAHYSSSTPLARSAPIFAYSYSGPRTMTISLTLHRDLMWDLNEQAASSTGRALNLSEFSGLTDLNGNLNAGDDYVDAMIKLLQSIAMPRYRSSDKLIDPPMVALRLGNEIFIKGIVDGGVAVNYKTPILDNNKYAVAEVSFTITEVDPYDADSTAEHGSFRGLNTTLEKRIYKRGV